MLRMLQPWKFFFIYSHELELNCFCVIYEELRKDGFDLVDGRYKELKPIMDELTTVINVCTVHILESGIDTNHFCML